MHDDVHKLRDPRCFDNRTTECFSFTLVQCSYLAVQDGAEEASLINLLTGRQNHLHLVMAESAGMVQVYSAQILQTSCLKKFKRKKQWR